jgi:hypothetical protein
VFFLWGESIPVVSCIFVETVVIIVEVFGEFVKDGGCPFGEEEDAFF